MRVAREDERVGADAAIFVNSLCHGVRVADERRAGPAADQAHACPKIGSDLEAVAAAAMQRAHSFLAHGIHPREHLLRVGDRRVIQLLDQAVGGRPGGRGRFADDEMQPHAKRDVASRLRRSTAHVVELRRHILWRLAPAQILVDRARGDVVRRLGGAAEVERWMRMLHCWKRNPGVFDTNVFA